MRIAVIRLSICVLAFISMAHSEGWEWIQPLPQGNDLFDAQFISANVGFAVGDYGTIIKTTDAGHTWQMVNNNLPADISLGHVYFRDALHGWVLENAYYYSRSPSQSIYQTEDGGATWVARFALDSAIYSAISFADAAHGVVVGSQGRAQNTVLIRTTDGGITWHRVTTDYGGVLTQVVFLNASSGWICGAGGLWHTTDTGSTWLPVSLSGSHGVNNLSFGTNRYGWADADSGLYRTTDGGTTWNALPDPYYGTFSRLIFANAFVGIGLGYSTWCLTQDGGLNWTLIPISYDHRPNTLILSPAGKWWSVGRYGSINYSTDNGRTWISQNGSLPRYNGVAVFDSLHVWISSDLLLLRSTDGGRMFDTIRPLGVGSFGQLSFTSLTDGWSDGDYLYHTTDGGLTWMAQSYWMNAPGWNISFFNSTNGSYKTVVRELGADWYYVLTFDGGANWNGYMSFTSGYSYDIVFVNEHVGWTTSYGGVSRSVRGPDPSNWYTCLSSNGDVSIWPISDLTCWAVTSTYNAGANYSFLRLTRDGGANWALVDSSSAYMDACFSRNGRYGMHWGEGLSYFTSDSGQTWTTWPMSFSIFNEELSIGNDGDIWIADYQGRIVRFVPPRNNDVQPPPPSIPSDYSLEVYPNPFNAAAMMRFTLPQRGDVKIEIFDVLGRVAATMDLGVQDAGLHEQRLNGNGFAAGLYFARLRAGTVTKTQKIVLLR
jgi:photosystem II stability/assembly factor-like uncharacterized protein